MTPPVLKVGLIADAHYAQREPAIGRCYRAALSRLAQAVDAFNAAQVYCAVQLGDLIDGGGDDDADRVREALAVLGHLRAGWHHVLGNHDVVRLAKPAFLDLCGQARSFYSVDCSGMRLIFLDACFRRDGISYDAGPFDWTDSDLPPQQVQWLRAELDGAHGPCILFLHQRLDADEGDPHGVHSRVAVRQVLEHSGKVTAVVQGHYHAGDFRHINGIAYLTLPAMVQGLEEHANSFAILCVNAAGGVRLEKCRRAREVAGQCEASRPPAVEGPGTPRSATPRSL